MRAPWGYAIPDALSRDQTTALIFLALLALAFVLYAFAAGLARAAGKVRPRRGDGAGL